MERRPKANRGPSAGPQNRRALIDAAREVFAERGADAPLSAVARRARVGQGSLYRHFPDRTALAAAVFDENIGELEQVLDDEGAGLIDLFDRATAQAMSSTALYETVVAHPHDERVERLGVRVESLVNRLLERDRARGSVGDHIDAADVQLAVFMLVAVLAKTDAAERDAVAARARALFRAAFAPR